MKAVHCGFSKGVPVSEISNHLKRSHEKNLFAGKGPFILRSLAEAVILQAMEDLWIPSHREESIEFFKGEGFRICAKIAGMSTAKQFRILKMLAGCSKKNEEKNTILLQCTDC